MRFIDKDEIARRLTYDVCMPLMRQAMIAFSRGETRQTLRSIIPLAEGRMFGIMPGAMGGSAPFGAKLISIFPDNFAKGVQSHQGLVVLFDPATGAPVCVLHAGEITAIRTAAASAAATDALARQDAACLAILGCGEQAETHARAIARVRRLRSIAVWGRSPDRASDFARRMSQELQIGVSAKSDVETAVAEADIICTVTGAREPILRAAWVAPGTHVNLVGSSVAGPAEADDALVARARFFVDSREGVMAQGGEFLRAKAAGLIGDDHILAEIGSVFAGAAEGRLTAADVTIYKSLGHVAQDLAAGWWLHQTAPDPS